MNTIQNKIVAIIGGGPGGLTLARLFQMNGIKVRVYERDINQYARPKGATLDLHEDSGLLALQAAGLMDAFQANYRPGADLMRIVNKQADLIYDDALRGEKAWSRPEIDRGPLHQILLDSLEPDTVIWDCHFSAMEATGEGWTIQFKNGANAYADLVVGADGANSKIRSYLTPIQAFYSGVTVVEGAVDQSEKVIPKMHALLNGGKVFALGDEKTLILSSKGDGSLVFYTGCKVDENWSKESGIDFSNLVEVISWFKQSYGGWDETWLELFEHASYFVARPQYCMPFDQSWTALSNLTILGDAAHVMPPYAGEGVNMAMLDALELSTCLLSEGFEDPHSAIAAYELQMRSRASEVAQMTMDSTAALHGPDAIHFMLDIMGQSGEEQD